MENFIGDYVSGLFELQMSDYGKLGERPEGKTEKAKRERCVEGG